MRAYYMPYYLRDQYRPRLDMSPAMNDKNLSPSSHGRSLSGIDRLRNIYASPLLNTALSKRPILIPNNTAINHNLVVPMKHEYDSSTRSSSTIRKKEFKGYKAKRKSYSCAAFNCDQNLMLKNETSKMNPQIQQTNEIFVETCIKHTDRSKSSTRKTHESSSASVVQMTQQKSEANGKKKKDKKKNLSNLRSSDNQKLECETILKENYQITGNPYFLDKETSTTVSNNTNGFMKDYYNRNSRNNVQEVVLSYSPDSACVKSKVSFPTELNSVNIFTTANGNVLNEKPIQCREYDKRVLNFYYPSTIQEPKNFTNNYVETKQCDDISDSVEIIQEYSILEQALPPLTSRLPVVYVNDSIDRNMRSNDSYANYSPINSHGPKSEIINEIVLDIPNYNSSNQRAEEFVEEYIVSTDNDSSDSEFSVDNSLLTDSPSFQSFSLPRDEQMPKISTYTDRVSECSSVYTFLKSRTIAEIL